MKSHRETYPDQYTHPLVDKPVTLKRGNGVYHGTLERVVQTQFGPLGIIQELGGREAYSMSDITARVPS